MTSSCVMASQITDKSTKHFQPLRPVNNNRRYCIITCQFHSLRSQSDDSYDRHCTGSLSVQVKVCVKCCFVRCKQTTHNHSVMRNQNEIKIRSMCGSYLCQWKIERAMSATDLGFREVIQLSSYSECQWASHGDQSTGSDGDLLLLYILFKCVHLENKKMEYIALNCN